MPPLRTTPRPTQCQGRPERRCLTPSSPANATTPATTFTRNSSTKCPAQRPGHRSNPELDNLKDTIGMLALNKDLTPAALRLAILEAAGIATDEALDALGITDSGNRRRAEVARNKARLPATTVAKTDSKRRSKAPKKVASSEPGKPVSRITHSPTPQPAGTRLPATTVKTDSSGLSKLTVAAGRESAPKTPLTSDFTNLTEHATVVSGPAGTDTSTHTGLELDLEALELLRTQLGAEVIATEPRPSPNPVADIAEVWTASEAGPCVRCETPTCRYGPRGQPACTDCRNKKAA